MTPMNRCYRWILQHDDSKAFIVLYIGLAVVLTIWLGLFWLLLVVGTHAAFEGIKQRHVLPGLPGVLARVGWELKLDFTLILFAFVVGVYMDTIIGLAGLGAVTRAGLLGGSRFAAWQRVLRGALLSVDDAAQVGRAVIGRKKKAPIKGEPEEEEPPTTWGGWTDRWTLGDRLSLGFGGLCVALMIASPWLTGMGLNEVVSLLLEELHPIQN